MLKRPYRRPVWLGAGTTREVRARKEWDDSMSDGCTLVSDPPEIVHCCVQHDKRYVLLDVSRKEADDEFLHCMLKAGFPKWRANIRYAGVRAFGWILWYT